MKFSDFWKPKAATDAPATPGEEIIRLEDALDKLAKRRADLEIGTDPAGRRRALLEADAPAADIAKLDSEIDLNSIDLEKLAVYQSRLFSQLAEARGEVKQARWRELYAKYHAAALAFGTAMQACCEARENFLALAAEASAEGYQTELRTAGIDSTAIIIIGRESLESFLRQIEQMHDGEMTRQATGW